MKRIFRAFLTAYHPHGKPAVDQKKKNKKKPHTHPLMQFHTFQSCIVMILVFSHPSSSHSYLMTPVSGLPVLYSAARCVCSALSICVYPQSQSMSLSTVCRFECRAGHQSRFSRYASEGEGHEITEREQLATADYSLFHTHNLPPPPTPTSQLSPAEASLLQWQRSGVRQGKRLLPQGHRHSSIPPWSKSENMAAPWRSMERSVI